MTSVVLTQDVYCGALLSVTSVDVSHGISKQMIIDVRNAPEYLVLPFSEYMCTASG